jgi:hypothetical protein
MADPYNKEQQLINRDLNGISVGKKFIVLTHTNKVDLTSFIRARFQFKKPGSDKIRIHNIARDG